MKKKVVSVLLVSAMTAALLAGCGSSSSSSSASSDTASSDTAEAATEEAAEETAEETTEAAAAEAGDRDVITVWHYFESDGPMLEAKCAEYNELQDEIYLECTYMSRDELMNQYTVGALSGELPDIGMVDSPDMASYIELGVFDDITEDLEAWGELDKIYPGPLSSCQGSDGHYYGLPQNTNCLALGVNMDLLAEKGFDAAPTSLDEFIEIASAFDGTSDGIYGYAMCCVSTEEGTFQLLPWLRSDYNGQTVNVDNLTAESAVHGLNVLADLVKGGHMSTECVNWSQGDCLNEFMAGKCAMFEMGTWQLYNFDSENLSDSFNYEVVLLPTGDPGTSTSTIGGENFGVCTGATNRDACVKFLEWFMSADNEAAWAESSGKIPIRSDAVPNYSYEQDNFAVFQDEMNYALARGPHAEWPTISQAVYTAAQSCFVNGTDAADALATAMETITPIVEANPLPATHQLD